MRPSIPKTIAVAVLVFVAHQVLYILGVTFTTMRDELAENTIGKLIQEGAVSGIAAYGALYAASAWFSNLHLRVLVLTFFLLVAGVNVALVFFVPPIHVIHAINDLRSPVVLSAFVAVVGAAIASFIYLRRRAS
jgi:hypothetical protein